MTSSGGFPHFDPRLDSIVRTETSRLRQKLREYYAGPGSSEQFVIEVPQRGYVAVTAKREIPAAVEALPPAKSRPRLAWAWVAVGAAALVAGAFAVWNA